MSRMDTGKLPPFKEVVVGAGKSVIVEFANKVALKDFYGDSLEAKHSLPATRAETREGCLFIEVRAIDERGTHYQNLYRIGVIGVRQRDGRFVQPYVITNTAPLEVFIEDGFLTGAAEGMRDK
jgi:hypothetical protein